jgi:hypothetical protein
VRKEMEGFGGFGTIMVRVPREQSLHDSRWAYQDQAVRSVGNFQHEVGDQ